MTDTLSYINSIFADPDKNLTRDEFLRAIRETLCIAAELIDEGCYDVPVPIQLVTFLPQPEEKSGDSGNFEEICDVCPWSESCDTCTDMERGLDYESNIEIYGEGVVDVHVMDHERCFCSRTGKRFKKL